MPELSFIKIGKESLKNVKDMKLNGFAALETIDIADYCFSDADNGSFEISECSGLKEVKIGKGCFSSCKRTVFDGRALFSL